MGNTQLDYSIYFLILASCFFPSLESGVSFFAESLPQPPTASQTPQDPAQFMLMGFMLLPLLFVIFGMLQHLSGNARRQVSGSDDVAKPPPGGPGRSDGAGPSGTA